MKKKEILNKLITSGHIYRKKKTKIWEEAFALYMEETKQPVLFSCNKCYENVVKWLKN